jgi:isopentenyl diphosphate isomerase/L-lactate dehydrogenase-like FMN-dependent dehydrogenase
VMMNFDQKLAWSDVEWLQSVWSGPIVLMGIQTVDDAKRGRAGVQRSLSNHGGRQLDDAGADQKPSSRSPRPCRARPRSSAMAA